MNFRSPESIVNSCSLRNCIFLWDVWQLFGTVGILIRMQGFDHNIIANKLFVTAGVLAATLLLSILSKKTIDAVVSGVQKSKLNSFVLAKTKTVRLLLKNIIDIFLFLIAVLVILAHWGINITPILTGAGILGLAISFGAQTLVKDIIAGFFIIAEDQFNVGDRVKIGNLEGEVYQVTLRLTILKDKKENLIYIPNSQISSVIKLKE